MNGCTLPGRTISSAGAVCVGDTTETAVSADCAVSASRVFRALTRDQMPVARRTTAAINAIDQAQPTFGRALPCSPLHSRGACASRFVSYLQFEST